MADPILIEQVLLNLLKNGLEAMENSEMRHPVRQVVITAQREGALGRGWRSSIAGHGLADPRAPVRTVLQHQVRRPWAWG
jgi:C4-dicarboxylate-specific signal transduction histidine kinase